MPPAPPFRPELVLQLAAGGRTGEAFAMLQARLAQQPRDGNALLLAAQLEIIQGRLDEADAALQRAQRAGASPTRTALLQAMALQARGETDRALESLDRAAKGSDVKPEGVRLLRAEALYAAGRREEFVHEMTETGEWALAPGAAVLRARAERFLGRLDESEARLRATFARADADPTTRRTAAFELVRQLDGARRYAEAFALAVEAHRLTTRPFDTGGLVSGLRRSVALAEGGQFARMSRASRPTERVALLVALPRSGTTLLEQMLDRHPQVRGVGEPTGVQRIVQAVTALRNWPDGLLAATVSAVDAMQADYLATLRTGGPSPAGTFLVDKSLQTWMALPAVAAALPGATLLRMRRDPRDMAVSMLLSPMHPMTMGWTGSLESIRRVVEAERDAVPRLLRALGLRAVYVSYERLVDEPRSTLESVLAHCGLAFDERCLAPEANRRAVLTLSQEQVRRPVNRESIGRWRNYAEHFGPEWQALADADALTTRPTS